MYGTATTFFFSLRLYSRQKQSGEVEADPTASIAETPLTIAALLVDTSLLSLLFSSLFSAIDVLEEDAFTTNDDPRDDLVVVLRTDDDDTLVIANVVVVTALICPRTP